MGAGGPRGATPSSRSGGAAVRRYPSSKVRSSGHDAAMMAKEHDHDGYSISSEGFLPAVVDIMVI